MKKYIMILILIFWICIIFGFSLQVGSTSSNVSNKTLDIILKCLFIDVENLKLNDVSAYNMFGLIIRKLAHMCEYTILSILTYQIFKKYIITFSFSVMIASIDEIIQTFIPNRVGTIIDVMIDSIGILIGLLIVFIIMKVKVKFNDN